MAAPPLRTDPFASALEAVLAGFALAGAACALDRARRGAAAEREPRWVECVRAGAVGAPDPAAALAAEGWPSAVARTVAERIAPLAALPPGTPADHWVGVTPATGVPARARAQLAAVADLAVEAAARLAGAPLRVHALVHAARSGPETRPSQLGALAIALDLPGLPEQDCATFLARAVHTLAATVPGLGDWLDPPGADPAVCVHCPPEHPGLPLVLAPFRVDAPSACDALADGTLPERILDAVAAELFGPPARAPH